MKYAGKVGTGFSMKDAQDLYDRLAKLTTDAPAIENLPRSILKTANWVKAALLCEVAFTEWTADGHIRHPSFQGLREDKQPEDVTMEKPKSVTKVETKKASSHLASKTVAHRKTASTQRRAQSRLAKRQDRSPGSHNFPPRPPDLQRSAGHQRRTCRILRRGLSRTFSPGIGLPGRVWSNGEPTWIPDVIQDGNFPRAQVAVQDGVHGAFAFAVRTGNQILGVMEFFSAKVRQPEPALIDLLIAH